MNIYYRIKNAIGNAWYDFRCRCQRFKRGYAYSDILDMDNWFMRTVKPMLIHLYHNHMGVPMEFENNPDSWKEVLNEMINCLEMMDEDNAYAFLGFCEIDDYKRMTREDYQNVYDIRKKNKNRFFELFSKYFYNLWD
ncbi:MAG: hypothetical protein PUE12_17735 [Oscillospiraceae bacterium]|nr:hypothetical protein [Oscillospiraceae bacterium]